MYRIDKKEAHLVVCANEWEMLLKKKAYTEALGL